MDNLPDAPWIREAERNGMPGPDEVICPCCGKRCESIYTDRKGWNAVGCEHCIQERDSYDWLDKQEEMKREE